MEAGDEKLTLTNKSNQTAIGEEQPERELVLWRTHMDCLHTCPEGGGRYGMHALYSVVSCRLTTGSTIRRTA